MGPYLPFWAQVFNGLQCNALDDMVIYPSDQCAA